MSASSVLRRTGRWLAVAESCTGGMVGACITDEPGASSFFRGCVVAYSDAVKESLLGVPKELLRTSGAVSSECALAMAQGVLRELVADVSLAVTGIAGPGGGSEDKPVGLVYVAAATRDGRSVVRKLRLVGNRAEVRAGAVSAALALLDDVLRLNSGGGGDSDGGG